MRHPSSSGKSLEVSGDLETDTGIWEESNYCLSVSSFLPTMPLQPPAGAGGQLAGWQCIYLCMHLVGAISLLDSALRAGTRRVSSLEQQVGTYLLPSLCFSAVISESLAYNMHKCTCVIVDV